MEAAFGSRSPSASTRQSSSPASGWWSIRYRPTCCNRHDESGHSAHQHDHNLRAAYLHVLADALTSFSAIFALLTGKYFGWVWMDPAMGVVGSVIIARWSYGLLRDSSRALLDGDVAADTLEQVRALIEEGSGDRVSDLHLWRVGPKELAAIVSVATNDARSPDHYKELVADSLQLTHVTVEVNRAMAD